MKSWLLAPILFVACTGIEEDSSTAAPPAPVLAEAAPAADHDGIHVPFERVRTEPDKSQGAFVGQVLGADTWVQISYHRPGVRERDVWTAVNSRGNAIVPFGGEPIPWRGGANEPTRLTVSRPVLIEDKPLDAGDYVVLFKPGQRAWTLILQPATMPDGSDNPGAYGYDEAHDVLKVRVFPVAAPHQEWLEYGFEDTQEWTATAFLRWAEQKIPFRLKSQELAGG